MLPMLVSDAKKFIFLHNPKAAGSSIRKALAQYDDRDNFYWDHEDNNRLGRIVDKAHIVLDDFSVYPDIALLEDYFTFGFVRNPYSRVYSAFQERVRQWGDNQGRDINEFIRTELNEINIRYDWNYIHFCPQYFFFYQGGKSRSDFIGRFETIQRDFARAVNLGGLDTNLELQHLNRSSDDDGDPDRAKRPDYYLEKFDAESLTIINRLYDRDFVYFGYDKFFADAADVSDPSSYAANAHVRAVYEETHYIKGEEAFFWSRIESLSRENRELRERIDDSDELKAALRSTTADLELSRNHLESTEQELATLRARFDSARHEVERMRNSLSWKMTRPLRVRGQWD
jgi:hypothetical protein